VPLSSSDWNSIAASDPRLTRVYDDAAAAVYQLR